MAMPSIVKPGMMVKINRLHSQCRVQPGLIGTIVERRRKGKGNLPTMYATRTGAVWVKFGREKDNNLVILGLPIASLEYIEQLPKARREKIDVQDAANSVLKGLFGRK